MLTNKKHSTVNSIVFAGTKHTLLVLAIFITALSSLQAQQRKIIRGSIVNQFTKEQVPFASIAWKHAGNGTLSDSLGRFSIVANGFLRDTLIISYVGFSNLEVPVNTSRDTAALVLFLSEGKQKDSVIVASKYNKGLLWWKKIVRNKPQNNPYQFESYSYELYNKLELDINNINRDGFNQYRLLRPFGFILDNIDSVSENNPFLPVFMTESLSDYYYTAKPYQVREEIKAVKTNGIKNETVLQFIGGINQRLNSYENYMTLFGKEFISPLAAVADNYYNFKGADTQFISGDRYFHLFFSPKREGENTFSGDCWVHSTTWAIKKINLSIAPTANINYINRLSIVQEFARQADGKWVFLKDKFIADVAPAKKNKLSLIARKTSMYRQVQTNQPIIVETLKKNTEKEQVVVLDSAKEHDDAYWQNNRHEVLSVNEQKVYKMIDTLKSIPLFKRYMNTVEFIVDGRKKYGPIEIGPWYKWISANQLEKFRLRFDIGTTEQFSRYLRFHSYVAYGFGDHALKGKIDGSYKLPGTSGYTFQGSYTHDLDNGRTRYNDEDATTDNMFSQLIRRPGIKQKFLRIDEIKAAVTKEWQNHLSIQATLSKTEYETYTPLPAKRTIAINQNDITNTEWAVRVRYAPGEKKIVTHRKDLRIRGDMPVMEARYAQGVPYMFGGGYDYKKISGSVTQNFRLARWGKINYMVYAGKYFSGPMPFMLLEMHPGNEIYYYNKQAFNLMNRFEFVSDRYAGFNIEHNFEKKLLNLLPFMRKSNMRQFWNLKGVWGDLSDESKKLNHIEYGNYRLRSLKGNSYLEAGTGIDNIFKFFRMDFVWRFVEPLKVPAGLPTPMYNISTANFGVFGSFHLQF